MEIKRTAKIVVEFNIEELTSILKEKLELSGGSTKIEVITETETIWGADPHDADYIERFAGIRIIHEE